MFDIPQMMRERKQLFVRIELLDRLIEAASAYQSSGVFPPNPGTPSAAPKAPATDRPASTMKLTEDAVAELLNEREQAVQLNDIVERLAERNVPLPEKNTRNVVSARLSNSKRFTGRRGVGWWFADRPWPGEIELLRHMSSAIGALNGNATSAPEDGEAATSPIENRQGESHAG